MKNMMQDNKYTVVSKIYFSQFPGNTTTNKLPHFILKIKY